MSLPNLQSAIHAAYQAPTQQPPLYVTGPLLDAARRQAAESNRQGLSLAARGAYFSARAEFQKSLTTLVQGIDATRGTRQATAALEAGLTALREAEDFVDRDGRLLTSLDLDSLADAHRTPVMNPPQVREQPVLLIVAAYHQYAQQQLAAAVGSETVGADALYGLGKLHSILAAQATSIIRSPADKAQAYLSAALKVQPYHVSAANDLAVLLARRGQWEQARGLLVGGLAIQQQPRMWQNLSVVHTQLGQRRLAQMAREESRRMAVQDAATSDVQQAVQWVDPQTFARSAESFSGAVRQTSDTAAADAANARQSAPPAAAQREENNWARLIPWNRWQR